MVALVPIQYLTALSERLRLSKDLKPLLSFSLRMSWVTTPATQWGKGYAQAQNLKLNYCG